MELTGIFATPVFSIGTDSSFNETVLCVQDKQENIIDLSEIEDIYLQVKSGTVETDCGAIMYILFSFYETTNPNDKFTYEVILDPCDMNSLSQYGILGSQDKWKVLVVLNNEILNIFEFDNVYYLNKDLRQAVMVSMGNRCTDFGNAKKQYFEEYDIDILLNL